jgi:hypothetical protein
LFFSKFLTELFNRLPQRSTFHSLFACDKITGDAKYA